MVDHRVARTVGAVLLLALTAALLLMATGISPAAAQADGETSTTPAAPDPTVGEGGEWDGTGLDTGGATGPSPTGRARPEASQRTLDTVVWAGLLVCLGVAVVVVARAWRDMGVDPPLVDPDAPPSPGGDRRGRRKSG